MFPEERERDVFRHRDSHSRFISVESQCTLESTANSFCRLTFLYVIHVSELSIPLTLTDVELAFCMLTSSSKIITWITLWRHAHSGTLSHTLTTSNMTVFFMSICVLVPLGVFTLVSCDILQVCHSHFSKNRVLNCSFSCWWSGILMFCAFNVYLSPENVTIVYL